MRQIYLIIFILKFSYIVCNGHDQIVQISIPKAGTNLLAKCIHLITNRKSVSNKIHSKLNYYFVPKSDLLLVTSLNANQFWTTHLFYTKEYEDFLIERKTINFFMYRDPRDQVVSFAFYMLKSESWPEAKKLSLDERMMDIIKKGELFNGHPPVKNVAELYEAYLPWLTMPNMLCIRFEDLIGSKGGGSDYLQFITIQKIIAHLGLPDSFEKINSVIEALFGNTFTFREGQIGSWKKYFKKEHIEAFKAVAGEILITLGYEKDLNW